VPPDEAFWQQTLNLLDRYPRPLGPYERVRCLDEKTSLQPRPRTAQPQPAQPGGLPVQRAQAYERKGALNRLAAFDTRSGEAIGICRRRKRQVEVLELLAERDRRTPCSIAVISWGCDKVRTHSGKQVRAWRIAPWFSIIQRKRLVAPRFADL
jgi:hypothetical protein